MVAMLFNNFSKVTNKTNFVRNLKNIYVYKETLPNVRLLATATEKNILNFNNEDFQNYLETLRKEFYVLRTKSSNEVENFRKMAQLSDIVKIVEQHRALKGNIPSQEDIEAEKDEDMKKLIKEEIEVYTKLMEEAVTELMEKMLTLADAEYYPSLIFEVNSGAGGQEAMLFARQLYDMYINFFNNNNWNYEVIAEDISDIGGLRHANVVVNNEHSYNRLRYEAGVHRVQRVPSTEKAGRIHTSTASVTVIPRPADVTVVISDRDLKIETKRASGAGGQHVNTTDSAVRIVHIPTGIAVECQSERSQIKNKETALKKLKSKLIQKELVSSEASTKATRKVQQGNLDRNEKIRTYNFVQDRITDHRIQGGTVHNLKGILDGGEYLNSLMQKVDKELRRKRLAEIVENFKEETTAIKNK